MSDLMKKVSVWQKGAMTQLYNEQKHTAAWLLSVLTDEKNACDGKSFYNIFDAAWGKVQSKKIKTEEQFALTVAELTVKRCRIVENGKNSKIFNDTYKTPMNQLTAPEYNGGAYSNFIEFLGSIEVAEKFALVSVLCAGMNYHQAATALKMTPARVKKLVEAAVAKIPDGKGFNAGNLPDVCREAIASAQPSSEAEKLCLGEIKEVSHYENAVPRRRKVSLWIAIPIIAACIGFIIWYLAAGR